MECFYTMCYMYWESIRIIVGEMVRKWFQSVARGQLFESYLAIRTHGGFWVSVVIIADEIVGCYRDRIY